MKKLAIIGTAVAALAAGPLAQSVGAMPADVTPVVESQTVQPLPAVALELGSGQRLAVQQFGPTRAEQRADTIRSEALNRKYRLGTYKIGPSLAEQRADTLRGEALNRKYGLGSTPSTSSSPDFQWGDAGIGAGVLFGVAALIGAGFFEVRHHGRLGTS